MLHRAQEDNLMRRVLNQTDCITGVSLYLVREKIERNIYIYICLHTLYICTYVYRGRERETCAVGWLASRVTVAWLAGSWLAGWLAGWQLADSWLAGWHLALGGGRPPLIFFFFFIFFFFLIG